MCDAASPIVDFYPRDFRVDLEGKRNDWEGVVLVPFIEEQRLLTAAQSVTPAQLHKVSGVASLRVSWRWGGCSLRGFAACATPVAVCTSMVALRTGPGVGCERCTTKAAPPDLAESVTPAEFMVCPSFMHQLAASVLFAAGLQQPSRLLTS